MTNVSIGGNVTDSVLVFGNDNYVVKIGDVNGGVVNIIQPSDKPKYSARPTPVTVRPRAFPSLLDRENEFEAIKKASQLSSPVSVWGQQGIGKTSFIRHLAHALNAGSFTSGLIYLNASNLGYEDLLQALFDSFFDSDSSYKPNTAEILHALQNIKALIFLDDLQIGRDEAASILDSAPSSLFILSSTERSLWGEGEVIPLHGLPESESFKLFEKELSRPLSDQEKPTVLKICSMLQGHPLQILQAASLARESGSSMENLLTKIGNEKTENKSMAYISMASLSDSEKQVLALLAAAGGNIVPLKHLKGIFKEGYEQNDIQRLITLGLVQSHSPRFSITDALVSSISTAWDITSWQDVLLNYAINWLSQQPVSALVEESSGLLIHTIKNAGERKKWREVIQMGRALEKFMIFYKRWQSWSDILNLILTAAKALNDSQIQAWALHQLGSRALYLGYANEARTFLTRALNLRQAIGDKAGMAITQHNINTLNGIITPLKGNTSGCRRILTYGIGAIIGLGALAVIIPALIYFLVNYNIIFSPPIQPSVVPPIVLPTDTPTPSETPTSTGTITPSYTPSPTSTPTITNTPTSTVTKTPSPTFTPTAIPTPIGGGSGQIAFVSDATGYRNIFKMDIANRNLVELTNNSRDVNNPTWSPNGNQIAFDSDPDGYVIFAMDADGSEQKSLTDYSEDSDAAWSPNGEWIAFVSTRDDGNAEIYVMRVDNPAYQIRLTYDPAWDADPTWSPDSKQIAFVSNRDGGDGFQIYVMKADGSSEIATRLPNNRPIGTWNSFPNWSHDGTHIVFQSRDNADSFFQIYVMRADGSDNPVQLTNVGAHNSEAEWSPDDRLIAFSTNRDGNYEIYIMNADGGDLTRLTYNSWKDTSPAWQPR